jgi:hypothetical protein
MEEQDIMNIWDIFLEFIPEKNREAVADRYITYLVNNDTEVEVLESILGNDEYLDAAIEEISDEDDYDDYENEDDE